MVGEAGDGAAAVAARVKYRPDVVLMDVRMPRLNGIDATARLTKLPDPPKVIVLTTFELDEYVFGALGAGASGFLLKDTPAGSTSSGRSGWWPRGRRCCRRQ